MDHNTRTYQQQAPDNMIRYGYVRMKHSCGKEVPWLEKEQLHEHCTSTTQSRPIAIHSPNQTFAASRVIMHRLDDGRPSNRVFEHAIVIYPQACRD